MDIEREIYKWEKISGHGTDRFETRRATLYPVLARGQEGTGITAHMPNPNI